DLAAATAALQKTVQELEQSRSMLQLVIEAIPVRVFWKDRDLRYLGCNQLFAQDAGFRHPQEVSGSDDFAMSWKQQAEAYRADDRQVIAGGVSRLNIVESQTTPDGATIWLNTSKVPLHRANGELLGVLGVYEDITERKRAEVARREVEAQLHAQEEKLRRIVEHSTQVFYTHDLAGHLTYVSPQVMEFLDCSPAEAMRHWTEFLTDHPVNAEGIHITQRAIETGEPQPPYPLQLKTGKGRIIWVEVHESPVVVAGQTVAMVGALTEITARREAEKAQRESELRFRTLANTGQALIWTAGLDKGCNYFNEIWLRFTGRTLEQELGNGWAEGVHPEDMARCLEVYVTAFDQREAFSVDYRLRHASGEYRWLQDDGTPRFDDHGNFLGYIGHCLDITARKAAEVGLQEREFWLNETQRVGRIGSYELDIGSATWTSSVGLDALFGIERESEKTLSTWNGLVHPEDRAALLDYFLHDVCEAKRPFDKEYRIVRCGDGFTRWVWGQGELSFGPDGAPMRMIGTIQDITERKQAEIAFQQLHIEMLAVSRQAGMAEVATTVLHNVGNVLNSVNVSAAVAAAGIRNFGMEDVARVATLLQEHAGDLPGFFASDPRGAQIPGFLAIMGEQFQAKQKAILQEFRSLTANIEHIKEIVAMQQNYGRVAGVTEVLPPAQLVEEALRLDTSSLERHGVTVVREFEEVPLISTDKHKVIQILVNLIRNAKHALEEAPQPEKQLRLRICRNGGGGVKIVVTDNGVGIPPENLNRIFNHGFTTRKDGHGFGLHGGANAARALGGALSVHSDGPGQGAVFTLELPLASARTP
ncbi:MAG: PAS domain S-box protein, partial [Chthoniobacteraceae bacterium]